MVNKSKYVECVTVTHTVIYQIFGGGVESKSQQKKQEKKVGSKHGKSKRNR